ncbi:XRE family transcriptional regulator [Enterocloster bolteae]|nr:XRE family transcriptional regulator [Enterocloster bolteae]
MSNMRIYDNICMVAKKTGISINSIEKITELSTGSLCKWNTVSPTVRSLKKVAVALGVSVEKLLEESEEKEDT